MEQKNRRISTRQLVSMAMLGAISIVLVAVIHFPLIPAAAFLEYDQMCIRDRYAADAPRFLDRVDIAKLHRADRNFVFVCHENRNAVLGRLTHELLLRQGIAVGSCACPLEQKSLVLACVPAQNGIIIGGGFYSQHGNPPLG